MKRKIIKINEEQCIGCGICAEICANAALEIIDGKAKLVKDFYCDGLGDCASNCQTDALTVEEIEAAEYDPAKTYEHVKKIRGEEEAKKTHGAENFN